MPIADDSLMMLLIASPRVCAYSACQFNNNIIIIGPEFEQIIMHKM